MSTLADLVLNAVEPDLDDAALFGSSVAITADRILIGAEADDVIGTASGSVYLFERTGQNQWGNVTKIVEADAQEGRRFGKDVAIDGTSAIVGTGAGGNTAYVFQVE